MTQPIVIPLDGSELALAALPVAKRLAELRGATLHLVHIARELAPPAEVLHRIGISGAELRGSVLDTQTGESASGIIRVATEIGAGLIVMCTHTTSEKTVGSTALSVLKAAACPVALVRPERGVVPWTLRRILIPHDGTPITSAAVRPATELACKAGCELDVLYVAAPGTALPANSGSMGAPRYMDQPQHEWPAWASEFVERLLSACTLESIKLRMSLAPGVPGEEVLRFGREHASDLIVLAWRGEWEAEHAITIKTVLRDAPCPVLVLRTAS